MDEFLRWAFTQKDDEFIPLNEKGRRVAKHLVDIGLMPVFIETNEGCTAIRKTDYKFLLGYNRKHERFTQQGSYTILAS
jgi:hypothetical protein